MTDPELSELVAIANRVIAAETADDDNAPRYGQAHALLYRTRGSARQYPCVDCGGPAIDWSYAHERATECLFDFRMAQAPFSRDPRDYDPRCRLCHKRYDLAARQHGSMESCDR